MRAHVRFGLFMLLCAAVVVGCGGGSGKEAVEKEIAALQTEATSVTDAEKFAAFGKKVEAIKAKIDALPEGDRKGLTEKLAQASAAAIFKGGFKLDFPGGKIDIMFP